MHTHGPKVQNTPALTVRALKLAEQIKQIVNGKVLHNSMLPHHGVSKHLHLQNKRTRARTRTLKNSCAYQILSGTFRHIVSSTSTIEYLLLHGSPPLQKKLVVFNFTDFGTKCLSSSSTHPRLPLHLAARCRTALCTFAHARAPTPRTL